MLGGGQAASACAASEEKPAIRLSTPVLPISIKLVLEQIFQPLVPVPNAKRSETEHRIATATIIAATPKNVMKLGEVGDLAHPAVRQACKGDRLISVS